MLPLTYQTPAAALLVVGGLVACFAGYRFFRIVLVLYGFIIGALLASSLVGAGSTTQLVLAAIAGGFIGGLIFYTAYFLGVALVFVAVNTFIGPVAKILTFPMIIVTLGIFLLVVNGLMLWLTSSLSGALGLGFHVSGFWAAFFGGLVVSIVSTMLSIMVRGQSRTEVRVIR